MKSQNRTSSKIFDVRQLFARQQKRRRHRRRTMFLEGLEKRELMASDLVAATSGSETDDPWPAATVSLPSSTTADIAAAAHSQNGVSTTITSTVATPTAGWKLTIEEVYRYRSEIWVLSSLQEPTSDQAVAQVVTQASNQVQVASATLPQNDFVLATTPPVADDGVTRVHTREAFYAQLDLQEAELLYGDPIAEQPTVVDPLADLQVNEDADDRILELGGVFSGHELTFQAESTESHVSATIEGTKLRLAFAPNAHGMATINVTATDAQEQSVSDSFEVTVAPVNDSPILANPLSDIDVRPNSPDYSIELSGLFLDVDDSSLTWSVASSDGSIVTPTINGSTLTLIFTDNSPGEANVTVTATDAQGAFVSDQFRVNVTAQDVVSRLLVADQVMDYHGQSVIRLANVADQLPALRISSSNPDVLGNQDVTAATDGSDLEITVTHQASDYGISTVQLTSDDVVVAQFTVVVLPAGETAERPVSAASQVDAERLDLNIDSERTTVSGRPATKLRVAYNDRALARMIRDGQVSSRDAIALTRPIEYRSSHGLDPREFQN